MKTFSARFAHLLHSSFPLSPILLFAFLLSAFFLFPSSLSAQTIFSKITNSPVVTTPGDSRSVNWVDVDNDDDLDLFITNGPEAGENNLLYLNDGTGEFTKVTGDPIVQDGKPSDGATWADADNDGDLDCFVVNWYDVNNLYYQNNGNGTFTQITSGEFVNDGGYSETASWGDYDNDGKLDLFVTNSGLQNATAAQKRDFLYHNDGNGVFTKVTSGAQVTDAFFTRSVNWTDYDLDGDLDIFVTNEDNENEGLYRNNGNSTFTKVSTTPLATNGGSTMSSSWGDYDNDGDLDVFLANAPGNDALFRNDGNGVFTKITTGPVVTSGGNSFGSQWADVDNDADLDLFVTNSFGSGLLKNFLFWNNGNSTFTRDTGEIVSKDLGWSYGCAFGDYDRDGDLDLAVATCYDASQTDYLYKNNATDNGNNWLVVKCVSTVSNRSAIGAKVWVTATVNGQQVKQLREISAQSGYCGQNQLAAHFGLADAESVAISVQWPSGLEETFGNLPSNQYVTVTEGQGVSGAVAPHSSGKGLRMFPPAPNPFKDSVAIVWEQDETAVLIFEIADLQGKIVFSEKKNTPAGKHEWRWNGKDTQGKSVASGTYVVTVKGGNAQTARQVIRLGD